MWFFFYFLFFVFLFFCIVLSNRNIIIWINCMLWFFIDYTAHCGRLKTIDDKAFVCLFVCTWLSSLVAWCKHFNTKWRGYASFIGQTSALGEMFQSTCVPHVNKISILIYKWVISIVVTKIPCYKLKLNVLLLTQRVYVAIILDILDVNRLHCIFNHLTVTVKKCLCHRWLPICSMVLFVYFIFSCFLWSLLFFRGHYFEGGKKEVWARKNGK